MVYTSFDTVPYRGKGYLSLQPGLAPESKRGSTRGSCQASCKVRHEFPIDMCFFALASKGLELYGRLFLIMTQSIEYLFSM